MPRYFFHTEDGFYTHDPEGTELPDLKAAQVQSAALLGAILQDDAAKFWDSNGWRLVVTDEQHTILFRLDFRGSIHRQPSPLRIVV